MLDKNSTLDPANQEINKDFNGLDNPFLASEIVLGLIPNCIGYLYIKNDLKVHEHIKR